MLEITCKNCEQDIEANFCSNCGQKKYKRIDKKYVIDEVQYLAIHTNKGFFYSVKNIIKNPGKTARDFISGNRVNHYKPLYLAFLLSGISTFIAYKIVNFQGLMQAYYVQMGYNQVVKNGTISSLSSYVSILSLILIPVFAIFTRFVFRKWGQNYYEHIIMNAFFQSYYTIIYIFIYPIFYFTKDNINAFGTVLSTITLATPLLSIWFYKGFYPDKSLKSIILKVLAVIGLVVLSYVSLIILIALIGLILRILS